MSREFRIKGGDRVLAMIRQFSATEKVLFGLLVLAMLISTISMAVRVNRHFLVPIPSSGGSLTEGVIGLPRLVNPVIAISDVDRDLSSLVFAGLLKYERGVLTPDLAKSYKVSENGLVYTVVLRDDVRFHDNTQVTADDVEFTVQRIKDQAIQSPRRVDWKDVEVKKVDNLTIEFDLKQPYAPFINNLTVGILPKHIWKDIDANQFILSKYNTEPIGAGPYKLDSIYPDNKSVPTSYTFVPFKRYPGGEAYISSLTVQFFPNEKTALDAVKNGTIDSLSSVSPKEASTLASSTPNASIISAPLPRIFAVFLNQNEAIFAHSEVRQALAMSVDKKTLIQDILNGYGVPIDGPIPTGIEDHEEDSSHVTKAISNALSASATNGTSTAVAITGKDRAKILLEKSGWKLNASNVYEKTQTKKDPKTGKNIAGATETLEFSIATADSPDLKQTAEFVKNEWSKIGAKVNVKVFEAGDLTQDIIRNRKYDALLFGEVIGKDLDLYAFWHSSQRNYPGLNLSMYVNSKTDKLLEDARGLGDSAARMTKYTEIASTISDDAPAIFLYSPNFIYITPKRLKGVTIDNITTATDRWNTIEKWYIDTDSVWKIFADK